MSDRMGVCFAWDGCCTVTAERTTTAASASGINSFMSSDTGGKATRQT
jgi:hypothetical protein